MYDNTQDAARASGPAAAGFPPVEIVVRTRGKVLRLEESLTTGSVYAVSVRGGAETCGESAILCLMARGEIVASATLANGTGRLSLMTSEMRGVCSMCRIGTHLPFSAVLRCMDEGSERNVGIGMVDVIHAGDSWYDDAESIVDMARERRPKINGVELVGNHSGAELGLQDKLITGDGVKIKGNVISVEHDVLRGRTFDFSRATPRRLADAMKSVFEALGGTVV